MKNSARLIAITYLISLPTFADESSTPIIAELEEVVVTALKRKQDPQKIPASITALSENEISTFGIKSIPGMEIFSANVQISGASGDVAPKVSVRGVSTSDYNFNSPSPLAIHQDEAYIAASILQNMLLFDVERIEILKGPQGTLYGKNSTGGVINIVTIDPTFEEQGYLKVGYDKFDQRELNGAYEKPLTEKLSIRIASVFTDSSRGYQDNHSGPDRNMNDRYGGRLFARYQFDEDTELFFKLFSGRDKSNNGGYSEARIKTENGFIDDAGNGRPDYDPFEVDVSGSNDVVWQSTAGVARFEKKYQSSKLSAITSYRKGSYLTRSDTDFTLTDLIAGELGGNARQYTQELRTDITLNEHANGIFGLFYSNETLDVVSLYELYEDGTVTKPTVPLKTYSNYGQDAVSTAVFSHLDYTFGPWIFYGGLRYSDDQGTLRDLQTSLEILGTRWAAIPDGDAGNILRGSLPTTVYDPSKFLHNIPTDDHQWTGQLGLSFNLLSGDMLYANYNRGYRSGAANGAAIWSADEVTVTEPEIVDAFEIGFKSRWWDHTLQVNSALFYYLYKNQQFVNIVNLNILIENAGQAASYGAETEVLYRWSPRLTFQFNLGLLDATYNELVLNNPLTSTPIDLQGNQLMSAPSLTSSIAILYRLRKFAASQLDMNLISHYSDEKWFSAYNDDASYADIKADAYWQSAIFLRLSSLDDALVCSLYMKNIENNAEPQWAINVQETAGLDIYTPPLPRRFGLDIAYYF